jgi:uncharacterized membrane protein
MFDTKVVSTYIDIMSNETDIGLSFQEKSIWLTLAANAAVYAFYFWRALAIGDGDPARVGALFGEVVVLLIAIMAVGHAVLAIRHRPERKDERDQRVATKAARNAYYVLASGGFCALGVAALSVGTFWYAHALLAALVLAEITKGASQLVYYRRGA